MIAYKPDGTMVNVTEKTFKVLYEPRGYTLAKNEDLDVSKYDDYTKSELVEILKEKGIEVKKSATKSELIALLENEV